MNEDYTELDIDRLSGCCEAPCYAESDICSKCGDHCKIKRTCPECNGEGEVDIIDYLRVNSRTIDVPYKTITCPECDGEGYKEV